MKHLVVALILHLSLSTQAQVNDTWIAFSASSEYLIGFKNVKGEIKIEPKFMGLTMACRFDNIIAAMEEKGGKYIAYYLTKKGKIIGRDSLYTFDNTADCENEGFIRFKDKKTDKVGLFNKDGKIVIPAIYDALSPIKNGMLSALYGAKKKYWDKHKGSCNHFSWDGGTSLLLNTSNKILIKNFTNPYELNFFSLKISDSPQSDSTLKCFKGTNDKYYTFSIPEKKFLQWFKNIFIKNLTQKN